MRLLDVLDKANQRFPLEALKQQSALSHAEQEAMLDGLAQFIVARLQVVSRSSMMTLDVLLHELGTADLVDRMQTDASRTELMRAGREAETALRQLMSDDTMYKAALTRLAKACNLPVGQLQQDLPLASAWVFAGLHHLDGAWNTHAKDASQASAWYNAIRQRLGWESQSSERMHDLLENLLEDTEQFARLNPSDAV